MMFIKVPGVSLVQICSMGFVPGVSSDFCSCINNLPPSVFFNHLGVNFPKSSLFPKKMMPFCAFEHRFCCVGSLARDKTQKSLMQAFMALLQPPLILNEC